MKDFIDIVASLCWGFKEQQAMVCCKLSASLCLYDLIRFIAFICNEDLSDIWVCMLVNLFQPVLYIVESLLVGAIVNQDDTHGSFIISLGNSTEAFLTSSIPHLQFNSLIIHIYFLNFEIDTYKQFIWVKCEIDLFRLMQRKLSRQIIYE